MKEQEIKEFLLQVKADSTETVRRYIAEPPISKEEDYEYGYAVGQLELAELALSIILEE
jgi:hypothetical protein